MGESLILVINKGVLWVKVGFLVLWLVWVLVTTFKIEIVMVFPVELFCVRF